MSARHSAFRQPVPMNYSPQPAVSNFDNQSQIAQVEAPKMNEINIKGGKVIQVKKLDDEEDIEVSSLNKFGPEPDFLVNKIQPS